MTVIVRNRGFFFFFLENIRNRALQKFESLKESAVILMVFCVNYKADCVWNYRYMREERLCKEALVLLKYADRLYPCPEG